MTDVPVPADGSPPPVPPPAPAPAPERKWVHPLTVFLLLMAVYHANGGFLPVRDAQPNLYLPVSVLTRGSLSFSPNEMPFMFVWELAAPYQRKGINIDSWDDVILGRPARELRDSGLLVAKPRYFLTATVREGRFVTIYGPGAGLSAVPFFGLLSLTGDWWRANSGLLGYVGKVWASALVAGSAVLVYLTLLIYLRRPFALALALLYGLGTCVWAEPSQALWQQTPTLFFIALGIYLFVRIPEGRRFAAGAGLAFGLAVLCRPTTAILLAAAGVQVILKDRRKALLPFAAAGALPVLLLLAYTAYFMGSPFRFGQTEVARKLAMGISGTEDVWQTPLWEGAAGLLVSPSRGLLLFSPFLAFSFWGAVEIWRNPAYLPFRGLTVGLAAILAVSSKWFEWFGGWSFGYRLIVELTPIWVVLLIPVIDRLRERKALRAVFAAAAAWAVVVQTLGAFAYDPVAWNGRTAYEVQEPGKSGTTLFTREADAVALIESGRATPVRKLAMDVAQLRFRDRLWSVREGQLAFLLSSGAFADSRKARRWLINEAFKEKCDTSGR